MSAPTLRASVTRALAAAKLARSKVVNRRPKGMDARQADALAIDLDTAIKALRSADAAVEAASEGRP